MIDQAIGGKGNQIMLLEELSQLITTGESDTVEFKKSTGQLQLAGENLCAFLNGQGVRVIFGVMDAGKLLGQDGTDATMQGIANVIRRIKPLISLAFRL